MLFFKFIFGQFPPPIKNNLLDKSSKSNFTKLSNSLVKITTFSLEHNYMSYNANILIQLSTFIIFTFTEMNTKTVFMLLCMVSLVASGFTQQRPCSEYNPCLLGALCKGGFCVPFGAPQCSKNDQCPAGKICSNAQCITSCALVRCKSGWTCYEGICYENNGNYCQSDNQCGGGFNSCRSNKCCYDPNNNHPKPVPVPQPQPSRPCNQYTNCGINGQCIRGQCVLLYCSTNSQCGRYAKCKNGRCEQITSTPPQTYNYPNPYSWQFFPQPNPRPIIYPVPVPPNTYPNPNYPSYPQHKPHGNHYGNPYGNIASYGGYQGYGNHHRNEQKSEEHRGGSSLPSKCHNNGCGNNQQCLGGICQTSVYGNVCSTNAQCPQSQVCVGNYCRELLCYSNGDCYGHKCISGKCCH